MEWRQISIRPESKTGRIEIVEEKRHFFRTTTDVTVIPAYTDRDVLDFYFQEKKKALKQGVSWGDFETMNKDFHEARERVRWPIEDPSILGKLQIPISDRQLEFEKLEPFIHLAMFETFTLEQQLLVLEFVDSETKVRLLKEVPKERQMELLEATTRPADEQEKQPETAE